MKSIASILLVLLFQINTAPTGVWNTGIDNTRIEITESNGTYSGHIISSDNPRAVIGQQILKDLRPTGDSWEGLMYAPKKDTWLDASLEEQGDMLKITVKSGFFSKTIEWNRD